MGSTTESSQTLVFDFGSAFLRGGFAGDPVPLRSLPTTVVHYLNDGEEVNEFGDQWIGRNLPNVEVTSMINEDGSLADTDNLITYIDITYSSLGVEPSETYALFTQPTHLGRKGIDHWRESITSVGFEFGKHISIDFVYDAPLTCYAHCVHTGLVVDFGWSAMRVVPVYEGYPLMRSLRIGSGGLSLSRQLLEHIERDGRSLALSVKNPSDTQRDFCQRQMLADIVKSKLQFPQKKSTDIMNSIYYMYQRIPLDVEEAIIPVGVSVFDLSNPESIPNLLKSSLESLDKPLREKMSQNVCLSGGFSTLKGFNSELLRTSSHPIRIVPPGSITAAGNFCVWTGGSILGSHSIPSTTAITREEYDEYGANILRTKCL